MNGQNLTPQEVKLAQLKEIFPEAFSEQKVDWEKLKATLGEDVNFANERYVLNWAGKSDAFKTLQQPTTKTLAPCKDESVDFDKTNNIFIEGENLEVLKILQKSYFGKVKMIYIDPPYNTGKDSFVYPDKFSESKTDYQTRVGDKDEEGNATSDNQFKTNSKENGQYHSNWLNMMYPRLFLAKNLLKQDGVIFVSIDDNEVHNLRLIMDEVFGEENFVAELIWDLKTGTQAGHFTRSHEYILCFCKQKNILANFLGGSGIIDHSALKKISTKNPATDFTFPPGVRFDSTKNTSFKESWGGSEKTFLIKGNMICKDGKLKECVTLNAGWAMKAQMKSYFNGEETFDSKGQKLIEFYFNSSGILKYRKKRSVINPKTIIKDSGSTKTGGLEVIKLFNGEELFSYPKSLGLLQTLIKPVTKDTDLILDFFAGSGTTAHAVMQLNAEDGGNRQCISVQLPEITDEKSEAFKAGYQTIAEISKERIRRAGSKIASENPDKQLDTGFKVFKLADSNFKQWQQVDGSLDREKALADQLKLFVDPVSEQATTENILVELMLKSGKDLNSQISVKEGYICVNKNELIFMLEKTSQEIINSIIAESPQKVIALDRLFKNDDQLKTNTVLQMKDADIEFKTI